MYENSTTVVRGLTLVEALDVKRNEVWRARFSSESGIRPLEMGVSDGLESDDVVVKLLHPAYEAIVPAGLGRRARTLRRIVAEGGGWVRPLDHGYAEDGRRYVASALHRASLDDHLAHGPTPWFPATRLIADAAATVAGAHRAGLAVGYLRPSTILLNGSDRVHVALYGTSTRRFDDGTAQFMAPELASGTDPMPASDVYSLSLILASLILGRPIDHGEPPDAVVRGLRGSAPERILEIVDYGLSVNLRNRFADAQKLAGALEAALVHDEKRPASESHRASSTPEERPGPLIDLVAEASDDDPTQIPFDDRPVELDDPTDPGMARPVALDATTDHFGSLPHVVAAPMRPSDSTSEQPASAPSGPLAELLTTMADTDGGDPTLDHQTGLRVRREIQGLLDGLSDGSGDSRTEPTDRGSERDDAASEDDDGHGGGHGQPAAPEPRAVEPSAAEHPPPGSRSTRSAGSPFRAEPPETVEPSRLSIWVDNLTHVFAVHRRRLASSVALIGTTCAIGAAILIGAGDLLRQDTTIVGGNPVSTSVVERKDVERSSPLNDQSPLATAGVLRYDEAPTTQPARRTVPAPAKPTTASTGGDSDDTRSSTVDPEPSDSSPSTTTDDSSPTSGDSTPTTDDDTEPTRRRRTSTTEEPATTVGSTASTGTTGSVTTERPTTTAEPTTPTTRRRRPGRP